jgi:regulator of replication initiation timing
MEKMKIQLGKVNDEKINWRLENSKLKETVQKLTSKLVKLEKDEKKRDQYEAIKAKIELSLRAEGGLE